MGPKKYLVVFGLLVLVVAIFFIWKNNQGFSEIKQSQAGASATAIRESTEGLDGNKADMQDLKIEDIKVGTGDVAASGKKVTVNYLGTLTDGTKFDSSYDRGVPFSFNLGASEVIRGWDLGVSGMKVGGKRKLTIPAELGYGTRGAGADIPPNATLVFEVELLKVE